MKKNKIFAMIRRGLAGVLVIFLILFLPTIGLRSDENLSLIYNAFVGAKSKYQGMIEIWNIDSFESGSVSKTKLLSDYAKEFQKENKGLYFMIRNVTESECLNMLADGQQPDMFSCSYGIFSQIKDFADLYSNLEFGLYDNFKNAGREKEGRLIAVAWCTGSYFLISTNDRLDKAKIDVESQPKLLNIALSSGYEILGKNSVTKIYSLGYGSHKYLLPQLSLATYNDNGALSISDLSLNTSDINQTSYSAYCNFIAGKTVMLLGTQRDVVRILNREKLGKVSDVIVEPLTKFTDLVQFFVLSKTEDLIKTPETKPFTF